MRSAPEFRLVLERFVAGLKDGHARVSWEVGVPRQRWPFTAWETSDGFVLMEAARGAMTGEKDGPHPGDFLLAAGGVRVEDRIAHAERQVSASTPAARRTQAVAQMHRPPQGPAAVHFRFRRPEADRTWTAPLPLRSGVPDWPPAVRAAGLTGNWALAEPRAGVTLLRVSSLTVEDWGGWLDAGQAERDEMLAEPQARIAALFREIRDADPEALILDLRGNGGGTDSLGIALARHLLAERFVYFGLSVKRDGAWTKPHYYEHDPAAPDLVWNGPLLVLIDEHVFSAADNFLRAIVTQREDVITVGRPTHGGTGAPRVVATLPHSGAEIVACTHRVYGPDGRLTEGRGTLPDVPVTWSASDVLDWNDADLRAALALLDSR